MTGVSCYSCGSGDHSLYAKENGFHLVKCDKCGLLYVNPRPSEQEIKEATTLGAHKGDETLDTTGRYMREKVAVYRKIIPDIYNEELSSTSRTWLDIGCGHGEFLVALRKASRGHVGAIGIEPNRHKISAARRRGLDVQYVDLKSHDTCYDTISLLNVYSHLPNPPEFLRMIRPRLNGNGELLLQTGDTANLPAELHPRPFSLPDHLSFASEDILSRLLSDAGFKVISVHKYPTPKPWSLKGRVVKEMVKLVLPNKRSRIRHWFKRSNKYNELTDMWVRAKVC